MLEHALTPKVFRFTPDKTLRVLEGPLFISWDIGQCLGYQVRNFGIARRPLHGHGKKITMVTPSGNRRCDVVTETGLRDLVDRAKQTMDVKAEFIQWFDTVVLPALARMDAGETVASEVPAAAPDLTERLDKLITLLEAALRPNPAAEPEPRLFTVNSIAAALGMSGIELNRELLYRGLIYKRGEAWFPVQAMRKKGLCVIKLHKHVSADGVTVKAVERLKWTTKGRDYIINLLQGEEL